MEADFSDETAGKPAKAVPASRARVDAAAAERNERLEALKAKLIAATEGMPDVSEEDLVDEILARRHI